MNYPETMSKDCLICHEQERSAHQVHCEARYIACRALDIVLTALDMWTGVCVHTHVRARVCTESCWCKKWCKMCPTGTVVVRLTNQSWCEVIHKNTCSPFLNHQFPQFNFFSFVCFCSFKRQIERRELERENGRTEGERTHACSPFSKYARTHKKRVGERWKHMFTISSLS